MAEVKFQEHTLPILNTYIHYYTAGVGSPLFFIHGHRADALRYQGVIGFLSRYFKVFAPDLPGFGKSPPLKDQPHTMPTYGQHVVELIARLKIKKPSLAGFSMGAIIAIHAALIRPENLSQLILLGTPFDRRFFKMHPLKHQWYTQLFKFVLNNQPALSLANHIQQSNRAMHFLMKRSLPKDKRTPEIIDYEIKHWRIMTMKVWLESVLDLIQTELAGKNLQVKIPALLIETPQDHLLRVKENLAALKKFAPNHKVVLLPMDRHIPLGHFDEKFVEKFAPYFQEILPARPI